MKYFFAAVMAALCTPAGAQVSTTVEHPVAMGHHHVQTADVERDEAFWLSLGGQPVMFGNTHVVKFPNVLIFLRDAEPSAGTEGSIVNHVGLQFPDLRAVVERLRDNGSEIITSEFVGDRYETDALGLAWNPPADTHMAFARAPNGTIVELYDNKALEVPAANHHIHFYTAEVDAMKAWYVDMFGAVPGQRTGMEAADLPGVNLTFSQAAEAPAGTEGRALDHIGFEVRGLLEFCRELEARGVNFDRPYRELEGRGLGIAFMTDPWGTYIELTEGLDSL